MRNLSSEGMKKHFCQYKLASRWPYSELSQARSTVDRQCLAVMI